MFVEIFPKFVNLLASLVLGTAFLLIARGDLRGQVRLFAAQSFFLSILAAVVAVFARSAELFAVALVLVLVKVFMIPTILNRAVTRIGLQRAVAPYLGTPAALIVCGLLVAVAFYVMAPVTASNPLPTADKRMLAYSSVEHMGIICLGLGFGGYWGVFGALLHVINHALSKSLLFMLSGNILLKYRTTETRRVRGLLRASPLTGGAFLAGTLALVGLPPFGPFISEFIIFRAGLESKAWVAVIGIALLVVVFAGMLASVNQMLYGEPTDKLERGEPLGWSTAPQLVNFAVLVVLGLTLPQPFTEALTQAIEALGG